MERPSEYPVPASERAVHGTITGWTDAFCAARLDPEYVVLARRMAAALCGHDPSLLRRGALKGWAAGIVYALCQVNYLFSMSHPGWIAPKRVAGLMGVSPSTAARRAREIRELLRIDWLDPRWTAPSNPLAWRVWADGISLDVRLLPREIGEALHVDGVIRSLPTPLPGIFHPSDN